MIRRTARAAFTMIEMLIAVAISIIVVSGLYSLFTMQSRQFLAQDQSMNMHQNLRFASDILSRSARMAGYGTGGEAFGQLGWDGSSQDDSVGLPPLITWNAWDGTTDAVTFVYADPTLEVMTDPLVIEDSSTTSITFPHQRQGYSTRLSSLETGDLLLCWDYAKLPGTVAYLWEIGADGHSTGAVTVVDNSTYLDFTTVVNDNLPPVMHCSRAQIITFYIDNNSADGVGPGSAEHPVLMMDLDFDFVDGTPDGDDIPLVDDIEDLQLAYCPADGDCRDGSGDWQYSLTRAESLEAWMVRFSLVARSPRSDKTLSEVSSPVALEDNSGSGTADGYSRQALTSKVQLRNLRMLHDF